MSYSDNHEELDLTRQLGAAALVLVELLVGFFETHGVDLDETDGVRGLVVALDIHALVDKKGDYLSRRFSSENTVKILTW